MPATAMLSSRSPCAALCPRRFVRRSTATCGLACASCKFAQGSSSRLSWALGLRTLICRRLALRPASALGSRRPFPLSATRKDLISSQGLGSRRHSDQNHGSGDHVETLVSNVSLLLLCDSHWNSSACRNAYRTSLCSATLEESMDVMGDVL